MKHPHSPDLSNLPDGMSLSLSSELESPEFFVVIIEIVGGGFGL